jgi:hypothetical protein
MNLDGMGKIILLGPCQDNARRPAFEMASNSLGAGKI